MWSVFQAIKRSWSKHFITQASSLIILTATYVAALFILNSTDNIKNIFNIWGKIDDVTIYLSKSTTAQQVKSLQGYLKKQESIQSFQYISPDSAAQDFKEKFKKYASSSTQPGNMRDFFPASLQLTLKNPFLYQADKSNLELFIGKVTSQFSFISEASYGQSLLKKYANVLAGFEKLSWLLILIIFSASLFVSSNVIKTVLYSRKEEIEILEFIGATPRSIYGPHVLNCCLLSGTAFLFAALINHFILISFVSNVAPFLPEIIISEFQVISPFVLIGFFAFSMVSLFVYSTAVVSSLSPDLKGVSWMRRRVR